MGQENSQDKLLKNDIIKRSITALVLSILFLITFSLGGTIWLLTVLIVTLALSWEWDRIISKKAFSTKEGRLFYVFVFISLLFSFFEEYSLSVLSIFILSIICFVTIYLELMKSKNFKFYVLGFIYISLSVVSVLWLTSSSKTEKDAFLLVLLTVIGTDLGGYVAGKVYGKNLLAPDVSPKKTWEGAIGGFAFGFFICLCLNFVFFAQFNLKTIFLCMFVPIIAQLGDLFESFIKRKFKTKDSSHLLPGHGGIFDRLDGLLPNVILLSLIVLFVK